MSSKRKGKVAGSVPVKLLNGIPVGEYTDNLVSTIVTHVTHWDNFSPCISWPEHKKANRVNELGNNLKAITNCPENFIDAVTWEKLCNQFASISDSGMDMSKPDKCSQARKSIQMNHSLGRTSLDKWKDNHLEVFGKLPTVPQLFNKAYMHIDPLKQLGSSTPDEEDEGSQPDNIVYTDDRRSISANLLRHYDEATTAGSDESTANTDCFDGFWKN